MLPVSMERDEAPQKQTNNQQADVYNPLEFSPSLPGSFDLGGQLYSLRQSRYIDD